MKTDLKPRRVVPKAPRIRALVYGEPGCGKTTLAATAEDHNLLKPVLFANIEGGLLSVAHRRDIYAVDIRSTEDLRKLYHAIRRHKPGFEKVGTLVIDNITELQTLNLEEIVKEEVDAGKNPKRVSYDDVWQEDYGTCTIQLLRLFRWFRNLDMNLIMTAHAKFVYPATNNRQGITPNVDPTAVVPMLSQKLMKSTMGIVDFVWYLQYDPESKARQMLTKPDGIYQAKTRGKFFDRALKGLVTNPTMPELYDLLVKCESGKTSKPNEASHGKVRKASTQV